MPSPIAGFPELLQRGTDVTLLRAPLAPGLIVAFGRWRGTLVPVSPLAAGKGRTEEAALAGCLGEMAENLSIGIAAHPAPVFARFDDGRQPSPDARALDLADRGDLGSEGCACHPDPAEAALRAVCERMERAALACWWEGRLAPQPLALDADLVALYRHGQAGRRAEAWRIDPLPGVCVVLVLTEDDAGGRRVIGTASDVTLAAATDGALREALLAEIALLAPPDHPDHRQALRMDRALAARRAGLPDRPDMALRDAPAVPDLDGILAACRVAGHPAGLADLTHPALGVPVVRCLCPTLPLWRGMAP